ncbi:MAG: D-amino acid aminotransferase [Betaproteobacteria bacterium]|nr:MAG: D-amino acid aminotransferase [Betaproteobacteria bacterium]
MIYLNGEFMPIETAVIPVLDRGFIFGDGVYEVIPVYSRQPFRLGEHLSRLQTSLDSIRLNNPRTDAEWRTLINRIVELNETEDQSIYLQVTRGVAKRDHAFPKSVKPTVFIMSSPLLPPTADQLHTGVAAITAVDNRWLRCDVKSTALLPNVLLRQLAADAGCAETLLLRDGMLTEGAASNVFVVNQGVLLAPPKSNLMLPGITYEVVLELAQANDVPFDVRNISESELLGAEEIWITSSSREILPVTTLNGVAVGSGRPGPVFRRMRELYQDHKAQDMKAARG